TTSERRDGVEQSAAMADRRDTQLAQILGRQPRQNLPVNVVVAKRGHILFEPEAAQPFGHIHWNCLNRQTVSRITIPARLSVQAGLWSHREHRRLPRFPVGLAPPRGTV